MQIIESITGVIVLFFVFGYAWRAHSSWREGYEIEAIWRMINAIFWAVVYYGYFLWR